MGPGTIYPSSFPSPPQEGEKVGLRGMNWGQAPIPGGEEKERLEGELALDSLSGSGCSAFPTSETRLWTDKVGVTINPVDDFSFPETHEATKLHTRNSSRLDPLVEGGLIHL